MCPSAPTRRALIGAALLVVGLIALTICLSSISTNPASGKTDSPDGQTSVSSPQTPWKAVTPASRSVSKAADGITTDSPAAADATAPAGAKDAGTEKAAQAAGGATPAQTALSVVPDAAASQTFVLALDEVVVRDADGRERAVKLDPPATEETLRDRMAALADQGQVFPVLYPEGQDRTLWNRRLVTQGLRVRLGEGGDAAAVARATGLVLKDQPAYAPGFAVLDAPDALAALAAVDGLRRASGVAEADVLLASQKQLRSMPNDTYIANQWHLKYQGQSGAVAGTDVNVESVWNYGGTGLRGSGIRIGVVDDGLQTNHPDLAANVDTTNDHDWNDATPDDPSPPTGQGTGQGDDHGTCCAGNAAAVGNNGVGVSGTAPEATLVGMRLIAASTTDSQEAEAMAYLPDIVPIKTNSWGPYDDGETLEGPDSLAAAALATACTSGRGGKGTIFLWAGGNGGDVLDDSNYDGYANSPYTIAIGAFDSQSRQAYYSEPGANLVVTAPSSGDTPSLGITTVDRTGVDGYNDGATSGEISNAAYTQTFGGTSSATPTAAGIVALILQANPNLGWRDVQEILIRSAAQVNPTDSDWATNSAGFHFNHKFGAGLIDAAAAVTMAQSWTNLGARTSASATSSTSTGIPDNNATGVTRTFDLSSSNIRVEQVTVNLTVTTVPKGQLEVTLTSPAGMVSRLCEKHSDTTNKLSGWTFSTVRDWGENSAGTWTLKVADRTSGTTGSLTSATITVYGAAAAPVNPPPVVQITSPANGALFSPGATVTVDVSATDLNASGGAGAVTQVQLKDNGTVIATDTSEPWSFTLNPALGSHAFTAVATDNESLAGTSATVTITLLDQPPVVTGGSIGATPRYADEALSVSGLAATDPENQSLTYTYQWESSSDGATFTSASGETSDTLATSPARAGLLWHCLVTAHDGTNASAAFTTSAVNVVLRPPASVTAGDSYSYQSGLVLRGGGAPVSRQAIVNEFSQGAGTAEWVEILTLQQGSFRNWSLSDSSTARLTFADLPVWDNIPAGTLIVIYNGASKDTLLPADDTDPADGKMIVSSSGTAYFSGTPVWPALGNSGDAVMLRDAASNVVSQLGYGSNSTAAPHLGAVGSGKAAYFSGNTDAGADEATQWTITSSTVARSLKTPKALLPGVSLATGSYSENFDTTPGASGTTYPNGWTAYKNTTEDGTMAVGTASSTAGDNYNYGSKIGLLGSGSAFDPGSIVVAVQNTTGLTGLKISYDVVKVREQTRDCTFNLEYSLTGPTSGFTAVTGGAYASGTIAQGTVTSYSNIALPAAIENQTGTVYLRWYYASTGSGSRDGVALDNVVISTGTPPANVLGLTITPTTFAENAGAGAATGTVTVTNAPATDLVVSLNSSDPSAATVPATVTILAGQTSANFSVTAVDDAVSDGSQSTTITASASGLTNVTQTLTVTDNEPSLNGVTPGGSNNPQQATWIAALRSGAAGQPALFRLAAGVTLPDGLTLDANTGLISGTVALSVAAGSYGVTIERYNSLGETVAQTFDIVVEAATAGFPTWIAGFPGLSDQTAGGDPDHDGLPNLIEYYLGLAPGTADGADALATTRTGSTLNLTFRWSKNVVGLTPAVKWSPTLGSGASWSTNGVTLTILEDNASDQLLKASVQIDPLQPAKFLRLEVTTP